MKAFLDLKQHINDQQEQTDYFKTNCDILLQFCIFFMTHQS